MDYKSKYIKYKKKYLNLTKNKIKGGIIDVGFLQYIYKHILNFLNIDSKSEKKLLDTTNKINKSNTDELKYWTNIEQANEILGERKKKFEEQQKIKQTNTDFVNIVRNKYFLKKQKEEKLEKEQTNNIKSMIEELKSKQNIKKLENFKMVDSVKYLENIENYREKLGHEDNIISEESLLTVMKKILIGNKFRIVQGKEFSQHKLLSWLPDLHYIVEIIGEDNKLYTFGLWVKSDNIAYIMFPDYEYLKCSKRFEECIKKTGENKLYKADGHSNLDDIENQVDCNKVCRGLEGISEDNNLEFEVVYDYDELNYYQLMIIYFIILNAKLGSRYKEQKYLDDKDNFFYWMTKLNLPISLLSHITNSCSFVSGSNISNINCQTFGYGFKNTPEYTLKVLLAAQINNDNIVDDIMLKLKNMENNFNLEEIIKLLGIERNKINKKKTKKAEEEAKKKAQREEEEKAKKKAEMEERKRVEEQAKLIEEQKNWEEENIGKYIEEIEKDISNYENKKTEYSDQKIEYLYDTLSEFELVMDDNTYDNNLKTKIDNLKNNLEIKLEEIKETKEKAKQKVIEENIKAHSEWEIKKMNDRQKPKVNTQDLKPKPNEPKPKLKKPKLKLMKKKPSSKITKPKREILPGKDGFKPQTQYEIYHKIAPRKLTDKETIIFNEMEEKIERLHEDFYTIEEEINNIIVPETLAMVGDNYKKTELEKLREEAKKEKKLIMTEYYEKMDAESIGMTLEEYRDYIDAKAKSLEMTVEEYKKMEIEAGTLGMRVEEYKQMKVKAEKLGITVEKYKDIKTTAELMGMTVEGYIELMGVN